MICSKVSLLLNVLVEFLLQNFLWLSVNNLLNKRKKSKETRPLTLKLRFVSNVLLGRNDAVIRNYHIISNPCACLQLLSVCSLDLTLFTIFTLHRLNLFWKLFVSFSLDRLSQITFLKKTLRDADLDHMLRGSTLVEMDSMIWINPSVQADMPRMFPSRSNREVLRCCEGFKNYK